MPQQHEYLPVRIQLYLCLHVVTLHLQFIV